VLNGHKTNKNQNKRGAICHGIQEVSGSIPLISTKKFRKPLILQGLWNFSF